MKRDIRILEARVLKVVETLREVREERERLREEVRSLRSALEARPEPGRASGSRGAAEIAEIRNSVHRAILTLRGE